MQLLEELALDALNKQTKKHLKKQKIKLKLKYIFLPPQMVIIALNSREMKLLRILAVIMN